MHCLSGWGASLNTTLTLEGNCFCCKSEKVWTTVFKLSDGHQQLIHTETKIALAYLTIHLKDWMNHMEIYKYSQDTRALWILKKKLNLVWTAASLYLVLIGSYRSLYGRRWRSSAACHNHSGSRSSPFEPTHREESNHRSCTHMTEITTTPKHLIL